MAYINTHFNTIAEAKEQSNFLEMNSLEAETGENCVEEAVENSRRIVTIQLKSYFGHPAYFVHGICGNEGSIINI